MRISGLEMIYITGASAITGEGPHWVRVDAFWLVRLRFDRPYVCL